jgi:hypothetical protein
LGTKTAGRQTFEYQTILGGVYIYILFSISHCYTTSNCLASFLLCEYGDCFSFSLLLLLFVVVATLSLVRREQSRNPNVFCYFLNPASLFGPFIYFCTRALGREKRRKEQRRHSVAAPPYV